MPWWSWGTVSGVSNVPNVQDSQNTLYGGKWQHQNLISTIIALYSSHCLNLAVSCWPGRLVHFGYDTPSQNHTRDFVIAAHLNYLMPLKSQRSKCNTAFDEGHTSALLPCVLFLSLSQYKYWLSNTALFTLLFKIVKVFKPSWFSVIWLQVIRCGLFDTIMPCIYFS